MNVVERLRAKIVSVRRESEAVRMRYVLICVSVSMLCIGALWVFSVTTSLSRSRPETASSSGETLAPTSFTLPVVSRDMLSGTVPQTTDKTLPDERVTGVEDRKSADAPSLSEWMQKTE
jgi:hypothetical protein